MVNLIFGKKRKGQLKKGREFCFLSQIFTRENGLYRIICPPQNNWPKNPVPFQSLTWMNLFKIPTKPLIAFSKLSLIPIYMN